MAGEWHLWIYCCEWSLLHSNEELVHSESDDLDIARSLSVLNGQALQGVDVDLSTGGTRFMFDLNCELRTSPAPAGTYETEPAEQWLLYQPDGMVLTWRGDASFAESLGELPEEDLLWRRLDR